MDADGAMDDDDNCPFIANATKQTMTVIILVMLVMMMMIMIQS